MKASLQSDRKDVFSSICDQDEYLTSQYEGVHSKNRKKVSRYNDIPFPSKIGFES